MGRSTREGCSTRDGWDRCPHGVDEQLSRFLPEFGQEVARRSAPAHDRGVPDPALVAHVVATTSLTPGEATRVVEDVIAFHAQGVEAYVRSRHAHLQTYGAKNPAIFEQIATELRERVFAAPELSQRQLRRIVYG